VHASGFEEEERIEVEQFDCQDLLSDNTANIPRFNSFLDIGSQEEEIKRPYYDSMTVLRRSLCLQQVN